MFKKILIIVLLILLSTPAFGRWGRYGPAVPVRGVKPKHLDLGNSVVVDPCLDDINDRYDWLVSSDRNSEMGVLSATNWRTMILAPGTHTATTNFVADTNFVYIASMATHGWDSTRLVGNFTSKTCADATIIRQTANNIRLSGFTIQNTASNLQGATALLLDAADNGLSVYSDMQFLSARVDGYVQTSAVITRCNGSPQTRSFKGTWINCRANPDTGHGFQMFGSGTYDPTMRDCVAGDKSYIGSYSATGTIAGEHYSCIGKAKCFGYNITDGNSISSNALFDGCISTGEGSFGADSNTFATYIDCTMEANSLGGYSSTNNNQGKGYFRGYAQGVTITNARTSLSGTSDGGFLSGTVVDCTIEGLNTSVNLKQGAEIRNSRITITTADVNGMELLDSNTKIYNTDIIVSQGDTGIPIGTDGGQFDVVVAHCRMNNATNDNDGLDPCTTNLVAGENVVDDDIK